ncbi:MAG: phosphatase [Candidatus Brocadiia bacterium]
MIEIYPGLYVGNEIDYERTVKGQEGWRVVHACKEPYHRQLLGYKGRGAPKDHPEYLVAERGNRLFLNFVDAHDPDYIPKEIVDSALSFAREGLNAGFQVLVHCNLGQSRSPSLGLLYLAAYTDAIPSCSLEAAEEAFREVYPAYCPKNGIRGFLDEHWEEYVTAEGGAQ